MGQVGLLEDDAALGLGQRLRAIELMLPRADFVAEIREHAERHGRPSAAVLRSRVAGRGSGVGQRLAAALEAAGSAKQEDRASHAPTYNPARSVGDASGRGR
jgi:hypothetical protein